MGIIFKNKKSKCKQTTLINNRLQSEIPNKKIIMNELNCKSQMIN